MDSQEALFVDNMNINYHQRRLISFDLLIDIEVILWKTHTETGDLILNIFYIYIHNILIV